MRKIYLLFLPVVLILSTCEKDNSTNRNLNDPYFEIIDSAFLAAIISVGVDTDGDGKISYAEAEEVDSLDVGNGSFPCPGCNIGCWGGDIVSLEGLKAFKNLLFLDCGCNSLRSLNVSQNNALEYLNCCWNELDTLDVSGNPELETLICSYNFLNTIDVSNNQELLYLDCSESRITILDVTNNHKLQHLDCSDYQIPELDLSNNPDLVYLNCHNNRLSNLDLKNNPKLETLWCQQNQLINLDISNNTALKNIQIHSMPSLQKVCVWTLPFPPEGVYLSCGHNIYFTTDCSK